MEKKFRKYYRIIGYSSVNKLLELSNYGYTQKIYTSIVFEQVCYVSCPTTLIGGFTLKKADLIDYPDILKKINISEASLKNLFIIENKGNFFYIVAHNYSVKRIKLIPNFITSFVHRYEHKI